MKQAYAYVAFYGTMHQCEKRGVRPMAWSPLAGGRLFDPQHPAALRLAAVAQGLLARYNGATLEQLAFAWILAHPSQPLPVIGKTQIERIQSATQADGIVLDREDWYALWEAAQGQKIP
jgi:predicted oxidoreductase